MNTFRLEAGLRGQPPQDQECAGTRQPASFGVEEQLRAVPRVEEWPAAGEVPLQCRRALPPDRHDALLRAFPDAAHESRVEVDARLVEADRPAARSSAR